MWSTQKTSAEKEAEIVSLCKQGYWQKDIAERVGVSPSTVSKIAEVNGYSRRSKQITAEYKALFYYLYMQGYSITQIAQEYGVSPATVKVHLKGVLPDSKNRVSPVGDAEIKRLWQAGYSKAEIIRITGHSWATVKKHI